jgi:hypothetical protein
MSRSHLQGSGQLCLASVALGTAVSASDNVTPYVRVQVGCLGGTVCVLLAGIIVQPRVRLPLNLRLGLADIAATSSVCSYTDHPRGHHGLPQVGSRLDCERSGLPVHLWRASRHRSVNMDFAQRNQEGMTDRSLLGDVSAADTTAGRQLEMQHLLFRHQREPLSPAFGKERA